MPRKSGASKKRGSSYANYLPKILKHLHGKKVTLSSPAVEVLSLIIGDFENRVANQAIKISNLDEKQTLSSRHVQTAVRLLLPHELAGHALAEGGKAVSRFSAPAKA